LRFIRRARRLGFALVDIRRLLLLADSETQICAEARRIAGAQLADIRARQAELAELEMTLPGTIAECDSRCCTAPAPRCPVLDLAEERETLSATPPNSAAAPAGRA
jgi:DNA-binding transcriptional MerR regulator